MKKRIGFACKYMHADQTLKKKLLEEKQKSFNTRCTTVAWLNRQDKNVAEQRLWDIMVHNIESFQQLISYVASLPTVYHMVRLGSDVLPVYTEPTWKYFWQQDHVKKYCNDALASVGQFARENDIKLSMHPGPFTVLASDNADIVQRSIEEFEYHVDIARWMGYGNQFQDFKINVHIAGRQGPEGIKAVLPRLSPEARNTITIENDEMSWGLDASLELEKDLALVLDIHHHWIRTGEYIQPTDDRVKRVIESWRGVRPTLHYSYSRNEWLPQDFTHLDFPCMESLLTAGHKKTKLRAHSDFYPNPIVNQWALSFFDNFDIMCESKMKNLASISFYESTTQENKKVFQRELSSKSTSNVLRVA